MTRMRRVSAARAALRTQNAGALSGMEGLLAAATVAEDADTVVTAVVA